MAAVLQAPPRSAAKHMSIFADDLAAIYTDTSVSVPVVVDGVTYRGFNHADDIPVLDHAGEGLLSGQTAVLMQAADVVKAGIANGVAMLVDGVAVTARDVRRITRPELMRVIYA